MKYQLLIYIDPSDEPPSGEHAAFMTYTQEIAASGVLVAGEALQGVDTATTVSVENGKTVTVDGPFAETKEVLGGFYLIDVPNLDDAIGWAARIPTAVRGRIEVRPTMDLSGS